MRHETSIFLVGLGLGFAILVTLLQTSPGYMDSEYYYANAIQLVEGKGLFEPFLWNYLDKPAGIPHPAFTYWMPLPSFFAALGMLVTGKFTYFSARISMILVSAILPVLVFQLSRKINPNQKLEWISGVLAVFSGYYAIYITKTDSFTILMILACAFYLIAFSEKMFTSTGRNRIVGYLILGILTGLMHLARADGLLWLAACPGILFWRMLGEHKQNESKNRARIILNYVVYGLLILAGYVLVTFWWYGRNLNTWSSLLPPGGSLTLWLTNYNQTFAYPSSILTADSWLASGWRAILTVRLDAVMQNLKTLLGVQLQVFMFPFMIAAFWKLRKMPVVIFCICMWLSIFLLMSFVFPFAGSRGGYLHSSAAVQPILWALFPTGLGSFLQWGARVRKWNPIQSTRFFTIGLIALSAVMTGFLLLRNLSGDITNDVHTHGNSRYTEIGSELSMINIGRDEIILVNNPPGFYLATGRNAIVIPDGGISTLIQVARKYHASIVVLEPDHPDGLNALYNSPEMFSSVQLLQTYKDVYIIHIPGVSK